MLDGEREQKKSVLLSKKEMIKMIIWVSLNLSECCINLFPPMLYFFLTRTAFVPSVSTLRLVWKFVKQPSATNLPYVIMGLLYNDLFLDVFWAFDFHFIPLLVMNFYFETQKTFEEFWWVSNFSSLDNEKC